MVIKPRFSIKAPIEGVSYSNEEVGLELEYEVEDDNWEEVHQSLIKQMKLVVKDYFDKLSEEIKNGQSEVVEELQVKLAKEYEDKLKLASEEIYKLRKILDDNEISY